MDGKITAKEFMKESNKKLALMREYIKLVHWVRTLENRLGLPEHERYEIPEKPSDLYIQYEKSKYKSSKLVCKIRG
jgi:hypothetical protein